jgi:hypothetical protein
MGNGFAMLGGMVMKFTANDGSTVTLLFDGDLLITEYQLQGAAGRIRTRGPVSTAVIVALRGIDPNKVEAKQDAS